MTVMTMKEISKFLEDSKDSSVPETMEGLEGRMSEINDVIESLAETSASAKDIICKRLTEKEFAEFMNSVSKITVFAAVANEGGMGLMMSMISGELQGYTHSVILATIGALINEEIL